MGRMDCLIELNIPNGHTCTYCTGSLHTSKKIESFLFGRSMKEHSNCAE